eukprot:5142598-Prorocentrum_lima.AAC.1
MQRSKGSSEEYVMDEALNSGVIAQGSQSTDPVEVLPLHSGRIKEVVRKLRGPNSQISTNNLL